MSILYILENTPYIIWHVLRNSTLKEGFIDI